MAENAPKPRRRSAEHDLIAEAATAWNHFFRRFRPDEAEFERMSYLEHALPISDRLEKLESHQIPDSSTALEMLRLLDTFSQRRFEEQNQRIDELMDLCEQMRQRLEVSELSRTHLEDEFAHCQAIIRSVIERHNLGDPTGLKHAPRLHNLFLHIMAHFEPTAEALDTGRFRKQAEPKTEDPPALFDYDRLRRLFRKG